MVKGRRLMKNLMFCLALLFASAPVQGAEPHQYGRYWQDLSKEMKEQYVIGFKDGVSNALYHVRAKAYLEGDPKNQKDLKLVEDVMKVLTNIHSGARVLADVMTDLYKDPANTYIPPTELLIIAQAKLDGKSIDPMLQEQRKLATETQKYTEERKKTREE